MSEFNSLHKIDNLSLDELDNKIQSMNLYLVEGRNELEQLKKLKLNLEQEISVVSTEKDVILSKILKLKEECDNLNLTKKDIGDNIVRLKNDYVAEKNIFDAICKEREMKEDEINRTISGIEIREKDLVDKELTMRIYAKSLEEKEKKLDAYADKLKRFIDQIKS